MKNYRQGPSGERPPDFNYRRGDPPAGLNNSCRIPCRVFWHNRKIWLTCLNSVCQDFLRQTERDFQMAKDVLKIMNF